MRDRVRDYLCGKQAQVVRQFLPQGQPESLHPVDNALSRGWYGLGQGRDGERIGRLSKRAGHGCDLSQGGSYGGNAISHEMN
ncbi:hypothetical protein GCM10023083_71010 [Streptomyces phyllanthi]